MEDCASTCSISRTAVQMPERVVQAAEALARLLVSTTEFQTFVGSARAVRIDPQVEMLTNRMNGLEMDYDSNWEAEEDTAAQEAAYEDLENQLESLPVVRNYRQAETRARAIFVMVDECISEAAGVAFAENAKPAACG